MATIYGELSADHREIFLVAGGTATDEIAYAAKLLQTLTPLCKVTDPPGAIVLPASWPAVVQLAHVYGDAWCPSADLSAWVTEQVLARTTPTANRYKSPDGMTPYPWQLEGAAMIAATGHALITDEPGTGKTATAILGLVERWAEYLNSKVIPDIEPILVICPASVVDHWVRSFRTWAPHWRTAGWRGPKRKQLLGEVDVYVTSYDTARIDAPSASKGALVELQPRALVIDECHLIKNHQAQRSLAVRRLAKHASAVIGLSGTPITHHPADLWPMLVALEPGAWPNRDRWVTRYCQTVPGDYDEQILGLSPYTEPEFRLTLLGQHRRVAKADVLADLPDKVYSVRTVELPAAHRKAYDQFEATMLAELPDDGGELSVMSVMAQFTHLAAMASAPADVRITTEVRTSKETGLEEEIEHVHLDLKAPSWKVNALLEVLEERPGQPVLAFAPSRQLMQLAGAAAAEAGLRVGYIVGGQSMGARDAAVTSFQAGELDLMCATTQAGGVGLTLTAAGTVVFLQRPWSLVDSIQAEDRAHRIGQEASSVEIIDIVAEGTIDTRVRAVLRERAGQLADLVQDPRIVAEILGGPASTTQLKKAS